jgi:hypothetical protein
MDWLYRGKRGIYEETFMPFMFGIYGGAYFVHADNAKARTGL